MRLLRAGDEDAWTHWFEVHGPRVWAYVARLTGADSATVADVVQDVFLDAARGFSNFDDTQGTLIGWTLGIAHKKTALFWRQKTRQHGQLNETPQQLLEAVFPDNTECETAELTDAVRSVVAGMNDQAAAILVGHYLEGRSTAQLANEFGVSEQAIRSRLSRARERFRAVFETEHREFVQPGP